MERLKKMKKKVVSATITPLMEDATLDGQGLYAAKSLIHDHGVEQRLVEAGLVFFGDDQN